MSRAFVNEDNAAAQASQPVERLVSLHPNYVTESGLVQLRTRADELRALHLEQSALGDRADQQALADLERDLRYYRQRLQTAKVVPPVKDTETVQIGSWVSYVDERDMHRQVCLVGEDQADVGVGLINWASPLGRALMGARVGDEVTWRRPAGDHLLEVLAISATPD